MTRITDNARETMKNCILLSEKSQLDPDDTERVFSLIFDLIDDQEREIARLKWELME